MATFYILYSAKIDRYYIGYTTESMTDRLQKHLRNHSGFTGQTKDWLVVYTEIFSSSSEAFARERAVKGWKSRKKIEALIGG